MTTPAVSCENCNDPTPIALACPCGCQRAVCESCSRKITRNVERIVNGGKS